MKRFALLLSLLASIGAVHAADITVFSAAAVKGPVLELAARFERSSGDKVVFAFSTAGAVDDKLKAGAAADLVINAGPRMTALAANKLLAAPPQSLGVVKIGLAVRPGSPHPDLSSLESFRAALLRAQSIAYGDPAKGPTTGIHFARVLDQLGIADAMRGKSILVTDGLEVMKLVAAGTAELGITQVSEILLMHADSFAGALPEAVQLATSYAISPTAQASAAALRFRDLLLSEEGRTVFRAGGFQ